MADTFPRLWARTRRFTLGEPRGFQIGRRRPDGSIRVLFLRALAGDDPRTGLWALDLTASGEPGEERLVLDPAALADGPLTVAEQARRERTRESATGAVAFSCDVTARYAVTQVGGRVLLVDTDSADRRRLPVPADGFDPRIDPTGRRIGYAGTDGLYVLPATGGDPVRITGTPATDPAVYWGRAEHAAAEEMGRLRGFWWAPGGDALLVTRVDETQVPVWWISEPAAPDAPPRPVRYPVAGGRNADVTLWRIDLDPRSASPSPLTPIRWDHADFEYLAAVEWSADRPLLAVQSRDQRRVQWLEAQPGGETKSLAEDLAEPWVELHPGAPARLGPDLVRIADVDGRRRLLVADQPVSPPELHLRSIAGISGDDILVTASGADPGSVGVWRIGRTGDAVSVATEPGIHTVTVGEDAVVIGHRPPGSATASWRVVIDGAAEAGVANRALSAPYAPRPDVFTTGSGIRVGVVLPTGAAGDEPLPVLMYPYGGPHAQRVTASGRDWLESQWWADQGFAVVVADGRGTPGVAPAWEHAVHLDVAQVVLEDQVEALRAAADRLAASGLRLDLSRVAIRGWSFGGFLAALAVLRRPDVFHAAVAGAPPTDWRLYDTHYTERYLGTDVTAPAYRACSLLDDAPTLRRPLLLVHGLADDNVVAANTLLLSQRLTEAGRPHSVLPLSGVTHMTPQEAVAENLLLVQLDFIRSALAAA